MAQDFEQPQGKGDPGSTKGRSGEPLGEGATESTATSHCTPRAGVVVRASVEHVGVVGDTELTVTVKWPGSNFCIQPCAKPPAPYDTSDSQQVPGNGPQSGNFDTLYGEASVVDPHPETIAPNVKSATPAAPGPAATTAASGASAPYATPATPAAPKAPKTPSKSG